MFVGNWHGSDESACTTRRHVGHACHASCFLLKQLMHEVLSHCFQFKYAHAIHVCWSSATFKRCTWHRPIRTPATAESSMTIRSVQHRTNRALCVDPKLLQTSRPWQDRKDREEAIAHVFTTLQDRQRNASDSPTTVRRTCRSHTQQRTKHRRL